MPDENPPTDPGVPVPVPGAPGIRANLSQQTITLPLGTVLIIFSAFLGAGGTAGLQSIFSVDQEVLDRIEQLEDAQEDIAEEVAETKKVVDETFKIVNAAHPPRGRLGVPDPE